MKKAIVLFVVMILALNLSAQSKFGIKAGAIFQSEKFDDVNLERNKTGFTAGIYWYSKLLFLPIYVQPELMYNTYGYKAPVAHATRISMVPKHEEYVHSSLNMPLLLGVKLAFLRVNAGPEFRLATFKKDEDYALRLSKYGFLAGGGLTFGPLDIDLRYRVNIDKSEINYQNIKNSVFNDKGFTTLTVGVKFGK